MAEDPLSPSLAWRIGSVTVMGLTGALTRAFMNGANTQKGHGLNEFLELLDDRADVDARKRGLITVSNHICVALSTFFSLGQVLPTHRLHHSPHGGPFQPTMREAVRLLSQPPFNSVDDPTPVSPSLHSPDISDPFSAPTSAYTYTTDGTDTFPAPAAYATRRYSWIHIFPEGRVHQHPRKTMRYFKWGVARLILEPDVCPDIIPMWIEGNNGIMPEDRVAPRWLPRAGKQCAVWFGKNVGGEAEGPFHELRRKWRELVQRNKLEGVPGLDVGVLNDELKYGPEAVALREECTWQVRQEVLSIRRSSGMPDEDPKEGLVETWREESGKREGRMDDGSLVKDT